MSLAFGLLMVGALNLISVAFFALFAGIGVDFGLQFSVRYRNERYETGDLRSALLSAAENRERRWRLQRQRPQWGSPPSYRQRIEALPSSATSRAPG